jgi:ribosome maturation factor RimP
LTDIKNKIKELAEEKLTETDYYVVEVKVLPANKVQVFLDSDTVVTVDECAKVSRHIEKTLDEQKWLGDKYILEVSSAGMDNPIKLPRQYIKHIGKRVNITTTAGLNYNGKILSYENEIINLMKEKEVKNDWQPDGEINIPMIDIKVAKRIFNF